MHKVQWKVPNESLNAEVIRQQVLYGGEHNIDLHFVDGVTECNIMPLTEMCLCKKLHYSFPTHNRDRKKKKLKMFATTFLKTSPLFLQEDQLCKKRMQYLSHLQIIWM